MNKSYSLEVLLVEIIIYFLLWSFDDYMATILSLIFGSMCLLVLIISLIVEKIEPSKVPSWYFSIMVVSILAPIITFFIFTAIGGELSWMEG